MCLLLASPCLIPLMFTCPTSANSMTRFAPGIPCKGSGRGPSLQTLLSQCTHMPNIVISVHPHPRPRHCACTATHTSPPLPSPLLLPCLPTWAVPDYVPLHPEAHSPSPPPPRLLTTLPNHMAWFCRMDCLSRARPRIRSLYSFNSCCTRSAEADRQEGTTQGRRTGHVSNISGNPPLMLA